MFSVESTILKLIIGLGSSEVQPQLSRISSEAKGGASFLVSDSEELNRALVLTIARAMHVTGRHCMIAWYYNPMLVFELALGFETSLK